MKFFPGFSGMYKRMLQKDEDGDYIMHIPNTPHCNHPNCQLVPVSPELLNMHAAVANVLHCSGMGRTLELQFRDFDNYEQYTLNEAVAARLSWVSIFSFLLSYD